MYQINAGSYRIYSPDRFDEQSYVDSPILTSEVNCASVLEFDLPPDSKGYNLINPLKTVIKVYDSDDGGIVNRTRLFNGRALYIDTLMSGVKHVYCEGDLAYLHDSVVMAYQYEGTVENLFKKLINDHNSQMPSSKQFKIGLITVEDKDEMIKCESTTYPTTFEEIQKQLLDEVGGYLMPRCEIENGGEVTYLDYLEEASVENSQEIQFGKNLIDISQHVTSEEVFTVLIPLGASKKKEEGQVERRVNISSVNGGSKELRDADGIAEFGIIYKVMIWDKIKDPQKLKTKGQKALARGTDDVVEIELSAVDLSLTEADVSAIRLGEKNRIVSPPHGFDRNLPCKKIVLDMEHSERSMYYFGKMGKTLTGISQNTNMKVDSVGYEVDDLDAGLEDVSTSKASLDSPDFEGIPTTPTPAEGTSNNQIANTEFVVNALVNALNYNGTWTPKLYDLNTYVRDLGTGNYVKIGKLVIAWFNLNNANFSGINVMMQIRNVPMSWVLGGIVYFGDAKDGTAGASRTVQASSTGVYLRPNIKSSDFNNPTSTGWSSMLLIGVNN